MPTRDGSRRIVASGGAQLYYREWGAGRPVVFVHGWAVNCDVWQYQMLALSPHARCISAETVAWIAGMGLQAAPKALFDIALVTHQSRLNADLEAWVRT